VRTRADAGILELLLIAALILLFGATTFTLVSAGGVAYERILEDREADISLRVALSYLTTQLRQHDVSGAVSLRACETGDLLTFRQESGDDVYETRIYLDDGWLREDVVPEDTPFTTGAGTRITKLSGFSCRPTGQDGEALLLSVAVGEGEHMRTQETVIAANAVGRLP